MNGPPPTSLDKRRIAASFERAATTYEQHDFLQREVASRALERLDYMTLAPQLALDVGSGTGRCARALAARYSRARIVQCDLAPGMLATARALGRRWLSRQRFVAADIEQLPFPPPVSTWPFPIWPCNGAKTCCADSAKCGGCCGRAGCSCSPLSARYPARAASRVGRGRAGHTARQSVLGHARYRRYAGGERLRRSGHGNRSV